MLSQKNRINKELFPDFVKKTKNVSSENMYLKTARGFSKSKAFAFIVSLSVSKSAVERNKIKRRAREITRSVFGVIADGVWTAVFFKPTIRNKKYAEIKKEMISLYKKAKII